MVTCHLKNSYLADELTQCWYAKFGWSASQINSLNITHNYSSMASRDGCLIINYSPVPCHGFVAILKAFFFIWWVIEFLLLISTLVKSMWSFFARNYTPHTTNDANRKLTVWWRSIEQSFSVCGHLFKVLMLMWVLVVLSSLVHSKPSKALSVILKKSDATHPSTQFNHCTNTMSQTTLKVT